MKRNNTMSDTIKRVYDEMVKNNYFSFEGNLKTGLFIDPGIPSAQAQKINSFIYGYDGDNNDHIISISDIYCQKIWITCFICANLLTETGLFKNNSDGKSCLSDDYNLTNEVKTNVFKECLSFLQIKLSLIKENDRVNNISEKLIKDIANTQEYDIKNIQLKEDVSMWITENAIKMLLLHEYSHIINKDWEQGIYARIELEQRADMDAYRAIIERENGIIAHIGALCLQSSGLFLNHSLEGITHPDTDVRIKYIYDILPTCEIFKDCLEMFIFLWAHVNNRKETFQQLDQNVNAEKLFNYLKSEKQEQINQIMVAGQKHIIN